MRIGLWVGALRRKCTAITTTKSFEGVPADDILSILLIEHKDANYYGRRSSLVSESSYLPTLSS
jgi:hypothetical protein